MSDILSVQGGKRMHNEEEGKRGARQSGSWPQDPISISYYNGSLTTYDLKHTDKTDLVCNQAC